MQENKEKPLIESRAGTTTDTAISTVAVPPSPGRNGASSQSGDVHPGTNGTSTPRTVTPSSAVVPAPAPAPAKRRIAPVRLAVFLGLIGAALTGGGIIGLQWWNDSSTFVSTDNAQIAGRLVYIGTTSAGRISTVRLDIGQSVAKDQVVASLYAPVQIGMTSNGQPRLAFRETSDALVDVKSPVDGIVIARGAEVGDTVPVGQSILTVVDPRQFWVNANIEETQVRRVQKGQEVTVHVDALNVDLPGRVLAVTPATAATFSLLPSQNSTGNFTKATQLVPVKIELSRSEPRLLIGTSANVKVRVRD